MPNRLAQASSPYLQQHADNPVDWYEWGQEAWDKAVAENKPVFLSVGYSSCHWCHVMAHESFEDQEIAEVLNRDYVSIKLDREERPDIDDIYMTAVQLATGHGGWPMSVFLTPDKKPFFAGTYFPRHSRENFPGFHTILTNLADAWREEQEDVQKKADEFAEGLVQVLERDVAPVTNRVDTALLDQAMQHFHTVFDYEDGGFGEQPKFPPHALLRFLPLYAHHRHRLPGDPASVQNFVNDATHMTIVTLENMAMGGIHDIVGGGFHRYAVDNDWLLPHFEKMLYDNGQLLYSYASVAKLVEDEDLRARLTEVADQICTWLQREMTSPEGIFYSALDADSEITPGGEKEEGAFYVWSEEELKSHLGDQAEEIIKAFNTHEDGNYRDEATNAYTGKNILHRHELAPRPAILDQLLKARQDRPAPGLDHKCICAWNGLMISGLAVHNRLDLAETAAKHWMQFAPADLPHQIVNGQPEGQAFLDDYVFLIDALLDLYEATQNEEHKTHAVNLLDHLVKEFADPKGGFHYTSSQHELLFGQTKPAMDNATPSPNGVAVRVLRRLGRTEDSLTHLSAVFGWAQRLPQAGATILAECMEHLLIAGQESLAAGKESPTELTATLDPREITVDKEGWGHTELKITVPPGHHINSHSPSAAWLTPTSINVNGVFGEAGFPDTPNGEYEGEFALPIRLRPKGGTEEFELTLHFQLCSESECYAPQTMTFTGVVIVP